MNEMNEMKKNNIKQLIKKLSVSINRIFIFDKCHFQTRVFQSYNHVTLKIINFFKVI